MSFNVNALPEYIEQNKSELLSATVLSPRSIDDFTTMAGVNSATSINLFANDIVFQNGKTCGFNAQGDTTLSQRMINPGVIKINMQWCDRDLLDKYTTHQVLIGANKIQMPFEQYITSDITKKVSNELEKLMWQGDKTSGTGNLAFTDGLVKLVKDAGDTVNKVTLTGDIIKDVEAVYKAIPEEVLNEAVIYMSPAKFREYCLAITAVNLYHYTTDINPSREVIIPGTDTKVRMAMGLTGVDTIYAFVPSQIVYGFDSSDDYADYKLWFSDDNDVFRLKISFAAGINFAFPQYVVFGEANE